jgi:hypothetical protein
MNIYNNARNYIFDVAIPLLKGWQGDRFEMPDEETIRKWTAYRVRQENPPKNPLISRNMI